MVIQEQHARHGGYPRSCSIPSMRRGYHQRQPDLAGPVHPVDGGLGKSAVSGHHHGAIGCLLEHNAKIPPRSVILIVDDRHHAAYFNQYFLPWWQADHCRWSMRGSAPRAIPSTQRSGWNRKPNSQGWWIMRATGVVHNTPCGRASRMPISWVSCKAPSSIQAAFQTKLPISIIWPGGGFSARSIPTCPPVGLPAGFHSQCARR